jgi:peptidoglycan/LPS O-acetylase OafA/YrhL
MDERYQPGLDGVRVIAALAVLMFSVGRATGVVLTGSPASWVASRGDVGVAVFFTLSGLVCYRPWAAAVLSGQPAPATLAYLRRRALRILPAYWVLVIAALLLVNPGPVRGAGTWARYLSLTQIYPAGPWRPAAAVTGLGQTWSLPVQAAYYLALPLLAAALTWFGRRGGPDVRARALRLLTGVALLGALPCVCAALASQPAPPPWNGLALPLAMSWFAAGMALAVIGQWARQEPAGPVRAACAAVTESALACWLIAALAFAVACTPVTGPETTPAGSLGTAETKNLLYAVIAVTLIAPAAFQPRPFSAAGVLLGNRLARWLGKITYGVFLWQYMVIYVVSRLLPGEVGVRAAPAGLPLAAAVLLAVCVASWLVAACSYYLVQRPARSLDRIVRPSAGRQAPHGPPAPGRLSWTPPAAGHAVRAGTATGTEPRAAELAAALPRPRASQDAAGHGGQAGARGDRRQPAAQRD